MATICRHHNNARHGSPLLTVTGLVAGAGLLGTAWRWGEPGPVLTPLLVWMLTRTPGRWRRVLAATTYFLAGSLDLPRGAATFFGPGHEFLGILLWIVSAGLLALPWIGASNSTGTLTALILDAVPPLGCFGWLSPFTAAGVFYPATGLWGLGLLLGLYAGIGARHRALVAVTLTLAAAANLVVLVGDHPPIPPLGWIGVDTRIGPVPSNPWQAAMQ